MHVRVDNAGQQELALQIQYLTRLQRRIAGDYQCDLALGDGYPASLDGLLGDEVCVF